MNKEVIRQCVGLDVSAKSYHASFCRMFSDYGLNCNKAEEFTNDKKGFQDLIRWMKKLKAKNVEVSFLMEATGVYHQNLAYFLHEKGYKLNIILPNKSRHFAKSLNIKNENDQVAAVMLAQMGVERNLDPWEPPLEFYKSLRDLTRYYHQLQKSKTIVRNISHAQKAGKDTGQIIIKSNKLRLKQLEREITKIRQSIEKHIKSYPEVAEKVRILCTIKGVALLTASIVIAETNGFENFRNSRQLVSYAGYDVVRKQSGTSVNGKSHISKKGNKYIRKAMYNPARSASIYDANMSNVYNRITGRSKIAKVGNVAVQRKLLVLMYTLWKKDEEYDETKVAPTKAGATQDSNSKILLPSFH